MEEFLLKRLLMYAKFLPVLFIIVGVLAGEVSAGTYRFERMWPQLAQPWYFKYPQDVAVDASGNVYVAERGYNRIRKLDSNGNYLTQWGSYGAGNGSFSYPTGVALDAAGNVYVADWGNNRIQKFDSNGNYLTQWGSYGTGNGQFYGPVGLAVDGSGNVYVSDYANNRIQKFDSEGNYLTQWGSYGTGNGQFFLPRGLAIDAAGDVYVVDTANDRIQKFDSNGNYLTQWGSSGWGAGFFGLPQDIAVDASGNVYVSEFFNSRIQKFDSDGNYLTQWGTYGNSSGQFKGPTGVAVDAEGNVYVADASSDRGLFGNNDRIQKFDSNGNFLTQWGTSGFGNGQFSGPGGVAVDAEGNVYVADWGNNRIQKFVPGPSLSNCTATVADDFSVHVPVVFYGGAYYWLDVQNVPNTFDFTGTAVGTVVDASKYAACAPSVLRDDFTMHIPAVTFAGASYWADVQYDGGVTFTLISAGGN